MAKVICEFCDAEAPEKAEGWKQCPQCGDYFCPTCDNILREKQVKEVQEQEERAMGDKEQKEARKIERLRTEHSIDRVMTLCPRCDVELAHSNL